MLSFRGMCEVWVAAVMWTSPVLVGQAMAMGAIPITSRHWDSALPELTNGFDLGPAVRVGGFIHRDPEWLSAWTDAVIRAATTDQSNHR